MSSSPGQNYNAISPSAKALLLLKGLTDIPFARETAELISLPEKYVPDYSKKDVNYWARIMHFEVRYKSIDQLLSGLNISNILELSSGFSFRGLAAVQEKELHYIDTDLPDLIQTKSDFVQTLQARLPAPKGKLEVLPLNALDEQQFTKTVARFPPGELAIVNEGLLMYLDLEEKKKLCAIIRDTLLQRGGCWITADIYLKPSQSVPMNAGDELQTFLEKHNVKEKMFDSFDEAERFFKEQGFIVDKEADPDYAGSEMLKYLLASATEEQINAMKGAGKIHMTWRLRPA